jgi:hypothetical protein
VIRAIRLCAALAFLTAAAFAQVTITTPSPLPTGIVGVAYPNRMFSATGGTGVGFNFGLAPGSNPLPPTFSLSTGGVLSSSPAPSTAGTFTFTVRATDNIGNFGDKLFELTINPALDITTTSPLPAGTEGVPYSVTFTGTGGTGTGYTFSLSGTNPLPPGLALGGTGNATLSGIPATASTYTFTIRLTDSSGAFVEEVFSLTIIGPVTITNSSPLPAGIVGGTYSVTLVATGGTGTGFTFALAPGSNPLPPGFSLSPAGVLSASPATTAGTFTFTVRATDSGSNFGDKTFSLTVNPPVDITNTSPLPGGVVGAPYSQTFTATGGFGAPYTFTIQSGAAPGLSLSTGGVFSGTPTTTGTFLLTIRAADIAGNFVDEGFSITITAVPTITTASPLPAGIVGGAYSQTFTATGGSGSGYTFSIVSGSVPGLSLTGPGNATLSGTPTTAGTFSITVRVTDSAGGTSDKVFSITIHPPVDITNTSPLPGGIVGVPYSVTLTAAGGAGGPYTFTIQSGAVPGLSLASGGAYTGTPTTAGPYSLTIRATDNAGNFIDEAFSLTVTPPVTVSNSSPLPTGTVGMPYSQTFTATGGTGSGYTFTVVAGALPGGLTLASSGALTGTPTAAGTFGFTIRATDSGGNFGEKAFTVAIQPPVTIGNSSPLPTGTVGTPYPNQTLTATGGTGAGYSFALAPGSSPFPGGLGLSGAGNATFGGTPTASGTFTFTIRATDSGGNFGDKTFSLTIQAAVTISNPSPLPAGTVGTPYPNQTLTATGGTGAGYSFALAPGSNPFPGGLGLSGAGNATFGGTPTASGTFTFTIRATDSGGNFGDKAFTVTIQSPVTIATTSPLPTGTVGTPYSQTFTATGGTGTGYTFALAPGSGPLPSGLTLASSGALTGTPTAAGPFSFTIRATDSGGNFGDKAFTVTIQPPVTIANSSPLPTGTVGTSYSQTFTASGGTGSGYTFTVVAGALPGGLTLASGGALTGTPAAAGTFGFTIRATDNGGNFGEKAFSVTIQPPVDITTTSPLPPGSQGFAYSQTFAATGGTGTGYSFTVVSGSVPAGLTLATSGALTGTPTASGTSSFTVRATDSGGNTKDEAFSLTINPPVNITTSSPLPNAIQSVAYSQSFAATGGAGAPYAFTVTPGSTLPGGLSLSGAGALTGTPTVSGLFGFSIRATDSLGAFIDKAFTLNINPALQITNSSPLPSGTIGVPYSQTLFASGGTGGGYSWALDSGTLPPGLALNTAGNITGTPTAASSATFTVRVTDSGGNSVTKTFNLSTFAGLTISTTSLPNGTVGVAYSQALAGAGGTGTGYVWTIVSGALPAGLTLSSGGAISGTPTAAGVANFRVRLTDSSGAFIEQNLSITVNPPVTIPTASPVATGTVGIPYTQTFTATGGTGSGYTFALAPASPPLPAGLTLNPAGNLTGTPTAAGTSTFTVRATDGGGNFGNKTFSITINPAIVINPASPLPNATTGAAYSQTLTASGGSGAGFIFALAPGSGPLPAGLALGPGGGITGTPTVTGASTFTVRATDSIGAFADKTYTITVNPPVTITTPSTLAATTVGVAVSRALAASGGTGTGFVFTVAAGSSLPPGMTLSASGVLGGTPTAAGSFGFTIRATDSAGAFGEQTFSLSINPPPTIGTLNLPGGGVGAPYNQTLTATGGTGAYTWSIAGGSLPPGLTLNSTSGVLSGTPTNSGAFQATIRVTDAAGASSTRDYGIPVTSGLAINDARALPRGTTGVLYSHPMSATGGIAPYTWAITNGTAPAGITLSTAGLLGGTPATTGSFTFEIAVTDSQGNTTNANFTMTVGPPPAINAASPPNGQVGVDYTFTFTATSGTPPYQWSVALGPLPPGLTFSAAGVLSGRPVTAGSYAFSIRVTDSAGAFVNRSVMIEVTQGLAIVSAGQLQAGSLNVVYSQPLAAAGGTAPYQWSIVAGALPPGMTLNASTGEISGTPTQAGAFNFTVQVRDAAGATSTLAMSILVVSGLTISNDSALPPATVGESYEQQLGAAGGTAPYANWVVLVGTLPPGMSLNTATGMLNGAATAPGTFNFTIEVTDSAGARASKAFTLIVSQPGLNVATADPLPAARFGEAYTLTLVAQGGAQPYQWRITSGTLPEGLTLEADTGRISGTAGAVGVATFTVQVSDSSGRIAAATFRLTVNAPPLATPTMSNPPETVASAQQPSIDLSIPGAYPLNLVGQITLTFAPDAANPADDPAVQFSSGGRTATLRIAAGSLQAVFATPGLALQTGTVAGVITLTATLQAEGATGAPLQTVVRNVRVLRAVPVIRSLRLARTANGFDAILTAYSNTRGLVTAVFRLTAAAGANLQTTEISVPLTDPANVWFRGVTSAQFGGQFTYMQSFTISGQSNAIASVSVALVNSEGASLAATAALP